MTPRQPALVRSLAAVCGGEGGRGGRGGVSWLEGGGEEPAPAGRNLEVGRREERRFGWRRYWEKMEGNIVAEGGLQPRGKAGGSGGSGQEGEERNAGGGQSGESRSPGGRKLGLSRPKAFSLFLHLALLFWNQTCIITYLYLCTNYDKIFET